MSKLKLCWGQNTVYDEYYTYIWVHKSVKDVLATVYLDAMVYDAVRNIRNHWSEAKELVRMGGTSRAAGKGKSKSKYFDTEIGDFLFDYKLAEVKDWKYDKGVMEHGQAAAAEDANGL